MWFLLKKSNGFMVLDKSVKEDIESFIGKSEKIHVIHSRDLKFIEKKKECNDKLVVSFIGAMNAYKDVSILLELLNEKHYPNIEFHLYSKGITQNINGLPSINNVLVKDEYFSAVDYSRYLQESDYVFLSYKPSYGVRFSGMVFDALNNGCQLICNNTPSFKFVHKFKVGKLFSDKAELNKILLTLKNENVDNEVYKYFSKEQRELVFSKLLDKYFNFY